MDKKKTVLLFCPHLLRKNGQIWELLHITKEKNATLYKTELISPHTVRNCFPKLPDSFSSQLNKFSEKQAMAAREEIVSMAQNIGQGDNALWIQTNIERKLHQDLAVLRPLLPMVQCYHQKPSPFDKNRLTTGPCQFSSYTPGLRFQVRKSEAGYFYVEVEVGINETYFPLSSFSQTAFLLEHQNEYFILRFTDYKTIVWLQSIDWAEEGQDAALFADDILAELEKDYAVSRNGLLGSVSVTVPPTGRVLLSEISGQFLMLTPQFDYDGFIMDGPFMHQSRVHRGGKEYAIMRDQLAEKSIVEKVEALHPKFAKQVNGYYYLSFDEAQKKNWFLKVFRQLLELNMEVLGMDMLRHFRYCAELPATEVQILKEEADFVFIKFSLHFGKEEVLFSELQKVIRAGQQAIPLKDGSIALLDEEWMATYAILVKHAIAEKDKIRVAKWLALSLQQNNGESQALHGVLKKEWQQKWLRWQSADEPLYPVPDTVNASLRIYQQKGYEWLMLLNEIGAGMFLADDMGLGKTLQTICFVATLVKSYPTKKVLIVCPASLIYNWHNEFSKFAPTLTCYVYHGSARNRNIFSGDECSVIISSYGTIRSDSAVFLNDPYAAVVLDESHAIKNPASQITRLVYSIPTERRLTLSGTPVMNNTFDLYSQLQFLLPGMFGSQQFFKREYADPIDRDKNEQRARDLQKLTAPFILRRTKEQVAKDLPPKTEIILWCQMEGEQRRVYNEIRDTVKGELSSTIREQGLQKSKLQVLQGIMKLRQVCNSPMLLKGEDVGCTDSVKTEELLEEIEYNLSNHKALVFSQFTSMLDILAKELKKRDIPYLLLTGATPAKERDQLVQEFNNNEHSARVFLLSLKAGNAGLNLTAADYVFLFDPWWNSAVEQQAIDRTHRIGQTKNVFAYKLICKDSIEERIIQLQEQKKNLAGALISEEEGFVKALTEDDIEFLLG